MRRFLVPRLDAEGAELELGGDEGRHLARVLRARVGDRVGVFDGRGNEREARVVRVGRRSVVVELGATVERARPDRRVVLRSALPKGKRMDTLVEKAVECGVAEIRPTVFARSAREAASDRVVERWNRIAGEAAKQCARADVPEVLAPEPLEPRALAGGSLVVADPDGRGAAELAGSVGDTVELLVGPEGGLTDDELVALQAAGALRLRLGGFLLRVETAASVGVTLLAWGGGAHVGDTRT